MWLVRTRASTWVVCRTISSFIDKRLKVDFRLVRFLLVHVRLALTPWSSLASLHVGLVYGKTSITVKHNSVIRQWNEQCRSSCKTECSVYSNNSNYAVVTCEIKLCWNNFEIISVFCFTCNHDFIRLKLLKLMTGAVQSLTRQGDN